MLWQAQMNPSWQTAHCPSLLRPSEEGPQRLRCGVCRGVQRQRSAVAVQPARRLVSAMLDADNVELRAAYSADAMLVNGLHAG